MWRHGDRGGRMPARSLINGGRGAGAKPGRPTTGSDFLSQSNQQEYSQDSRSLDCVTELLAESFFIWRNY